MISEGPHIYKLMCARVCVSVCLCVNPLILLVSFNQHDELQLHFLFQLVSSSSEDPQTELHLCRIWTTTHRNTDSEPDHWPSLIHNKPAAFSHVLLAFDGFCHLMRIRLKTSLIQNFLCAQTNHFSFCDGDTLHCKTSTNFCTNFYSL